MEEELRMWRSRRNGQSSRSKINCACIAVFCPSDIIPSTETHRMIGSDRVVALIPARAGSKTIPHKNLQLLGDKPLVSWPIDVARATPEVDRIIVSTDGDRIAEAARRHGAEVAIRPA